MQIETSGYILLSLDGILEAIGCNWQSFKKEYSLAPTIKTKAADSTYRRAITGQYPLLCDIFASTALRYLVHSHETANICN